MILSLRICNKTFWVIKASGVYKLWKNLLRVEPLNEIAPVQRFFCYIFVSFLEEFYIDEIQEIMVSCEITL